MVTILIVIAVIFAFCIAANFVAFYFIEKKEVLKMMALDYYAAEYLSTSIFNRHLDVDSNFYEQISKLEVPKKEEIIEYANINKEELIEKYINKNSSNKNSDNNGPIKEIK